MRRARQPKSRAEKSTSALKKDDLSPKAAPRSPAFSQALTNARSYAKDPERLRQLFKEAVKKAPTIPREQFKDLWAYFQAMLRLIRAYYRREYRNIPMQNLVMIVAAIIYILNPFDLIPDWIIGLGFADDAVVLAFAVRRTRQTLDDFMTWEIASRDRPAP
jgi:uncharacterized membrane protein YkvA (DUF1232 family)